MAIKDSWVMPVIAVDDIDRAEIFYRDKLGLSVKRTPDDPNGRMVEVGHGYLYLYHSDYRRGETTAASFMVDDVESSVRDLRSRGVTFQDIDQPGLKTDNGIATLGDNVKSAWFKDSEGNTIAITTDNSEAMRRAA
jgi:catechol 2,3-dioxygenase-like lactoylglutathione lyase family enzyme